MPHAIRRSSSGFQESGDADQSAIHRIDPESKPLERERAEQRLRARLTPHDEGRLGAFVEPDPDPGHGIAHFPAVRQYEHPFLIRPHAQSLEHVTRDPRVGSASAYEGSDRFGTGSSGAREVDSNPKQIHFALVTDLRRI